MTGEFSLESAKLAAPVALRWVCVAGALNLAWEVIQLPLYTIYDQGAPAEIAFAAAHCTAGDVLIASACYLIAAAFARDLAWPMRRPGAGIAAVIASGLMYAAFSEWLNVSVRGAWAYATAMPQLLGIGLSPLLQWIAVPAIALYLTRGPRQAGHGA